MPAIKDPGREAQRVLAVIAALKRDRRWLRAIEPQNFTVAGLRRRGQNSTTTGAESQAFKLAQCYVEAVLRVLPKQ